MRLDRNGAGGLASVTVARISRTSGRFLTVGLAAALVAETALQAQEPPDPGTRLFFGGKQTARSAVEPQLSTPVRAALDQWIEAAGRLDLGIALGQAPEHVVLGHGRDQTLVDAARWMDETFAILDALVPLAGERTRKATVAILVDEKYVRSPHWPALLLELQARKLLIPQAVDYLEREPEGVTLRQSPLFLQPTYDLTGEGEFRLPNEVAHKFAQCLLTSRTGQQPPQVLWGLGYVVEQRLFESSYHYQLREFVYSSSHFDWKREARRELDERRKQDNFTLVAFALDDDSAGKPQVSQQLVWASMAYLSARDPPALGALLLRLAEIQSEADPHGVAPTYTGDAAATREALSRTLDAIDDGELSAWLGEKQPRPDKSGK